MKLLRLLPGLLLALLLAAAHAGTDPAAPPQVMVMLNLPAPHYRPDAAYAAGYLNDRGRIARRALARELARQHGLTLLSDWPMPVLGVDCYVMALPAGADPQRIAELLAADKRVEWAQPVTTFRALGADDPLLAAQPAAARWHLADLHRTATGRAVTVAVIDSGMDDQHPDLAGQVAYRQNFIDGQDYLAERHGTAVGGIIAAHAENGIGIRGIAPGAQLLALRACREAPGKAAGCDSFSLAKALNFAILRQPRVINLSLTGPPDRLLQRLLDAALGRGIEVVGAADPQLADGGFPASWPGVIAVSGDAAPGRDIPTTLPGGGFGVVSGSSYASAHVSGLLALIGEVRPAAAAAQLRAWLPAGAPIDACAALAQAARACVCSCAGGGLKAVRQP